MAVPINEKTLPVGQGFVCSIKPNDQPLPAFPRGNQDSGDRNGA
jgi:hypothetical protein